MFGLGMPSLSSVHLTGRFEALHSGVISSFSEAGYLIRRRPHPDHAFLKQAKPPMLLSDKLPSCSELRDEGS